MMRNLARIILIAILALFFVGQISEAGIKKVAKRINMISFYGGYSTPTGSYDSFGSDSWSDIFGLNETSPSVNGSDVYKSTYHIGFDYGQLRNRRMLTTFGFRYTRAKLQDSVIVPFQTGTGILSFDNNVFKVHLYELELNFDYFVTDPEQTIVAPYLGIGGKAGFMTFSTNQVDPDSGVKYANENELKFAVTFNFGADLKLWEAPSGRSYLALSSVNSWDILASGNRPRYLNIGGAIKYYFRP